MAAAADKHGNEDDKGYIACTHACSEVSSKPLKERLRNPKLAAAVREIPLGAAEDFYKNGNALFKQQRYAIAFQHFDLCVLKRPKEWLFRLARACSAYHLGVYSLAAHDAAFAWDLRQHEDRSKETQEIRAALMAPLRKRVESEARRNKARCAYWQGKALFAKGQWKQARIAFERADYTFPSEAARNHLAKIAKLALTGQEGGTPTGLMSEKRLFYDPAADEEYFLLDILSHPCEYLALRTLGGPSDFIFERKSYDDMLCELATTISSYKVE